MVGFNIDNFISNINANGVMRNNKFLVRINTPAGFTGQSILKETGRYLELWCETASLPPAILTTESVNRYGYGHMEKRPAHIQTDDLSLVFIGDGRAAIWTFMQQWIRMIYNYDLSDSLLKNNGVMPSQKPMELAYKSDYAVNIELFVFSESGEQLLSIMFREAYPHALTSIPLNWSDTNSIIKVPVTFTYFDWYNTDTRYNRN